MASLRSTPGQRRGLPMQVTAVFGVVAAAIAVVRLGWIGGTIPVIVILLTLVPTVIEKWARIRIPFSLQLQYAVLLVAGPYLGGHLGLYRQTSLWDTMIHLYSGIPVAFAVVLLIGITGQRYRSTPPVWFEPVLIIAVKALVALLWEVGEFYLDLVFDADTPAHNFDTMTDMIASLGPAILIAAALVLHRTKGWFSYFGFLLTLPQPATAKP